MTQTTTKAGQIRFGCGHREMALIDPADKWDRVEGDGSGGVIVTDRSDTLCSCCRSLKAGDGIWRRAKRSDMDITYPSGRVRVVVRQTGDVSDNMIASHETAQQVEDRLVAELSARVAYRHTR